MLRLIAPLISSFANGSFKKTIKHTQYLAICYAIVGLALFFALIFSCFIGFIALTWFVAPVFAATIIVVFWLIIALIALIIGRIIAAKKQATYNKKIQDEQSSLIIASAMAAIPALIGNKKILRVAVPLIGLAAVFLAANKSKLDK